MARVVVEDVATWLDVEVEEGEATWVDGGEAGELAAICCVDHFAVEGDGHVAGAGEGECGGHVVNIGHVVSIGHVVR